MKHILKCEVCGAYTMKKECKCGGTAHEPKPPKYSPEDNYGNYRRKAKKQELEKKGWL